MSKLFQSSGGIAALATELIRKPSHRDKLLAQAVAQRSMLTTTTLPLLVQKVLREPVPSSSEAEPLSQPSNRWQLALGIVSSPTLRNAGIRPDPSLWGVIEGATPNAASRSACSAALKELYRPQRK